MVDRGQFITATEAHDIATQAADEGSTKAIGRVFALLGVDLDDFESVQEFRGDLQWVKSGRRLSRTIKGKSLSSMVGAASIAALYFAFDWLKRLLHIT